MLVSNLKLYIIVLICFIFTKEINATEYVAYSLNTAKSKILSTPRGKDYREFHPSVFTLGGITTMRGLVYDTKNGDVILVGERSPNRAILTLDDFIVALRAKHVYGKWPSVSIDPTPETEETQMQTVRYEGGIENTQFGQDLFEADYRLKKIGMGFIQPGIDRFRNYWDLLTFEELKREVGSKRKICSRFWFYPILPSVTVREDLAAIKGLKVGVFTEVLSAEIDGKEVSNLSTFQDVPGSIFAKQISDNFEQLSKIHLSFSRVQGLNEMVALTKAIEEMETTPALSYWLQDYHIKRIPTKKKIETVKRKGVYSELSGGVQLMAIALRLRSGDVTALKEAVLKTRPNISCLSWRFIVDEWIIPTSYATSKDDDIASLYAQAQFLRKKQHYDDALKLFNKIIDIFPEWIQAYNDRGIIFCITGYYDEGISDFNKILEVNPQNAVVLNNRGSAYREKGRYEKALFDYAKAIEIDPSLPLVYLNCGIVHHNRSAYNKAIENYTTALELNPNYTEAYILRGHVYYSINEYDRAISDFNKALEIESNNGLVYALLGDVYIKKGLYSAAGLAYNRAAAIDSKYLPDSKHINEQIRQRFDGLVELEKYNLRTLYY